MNSTVCNACQGAGEVETMETLANDRIRVSLMNCWRCGGTGAMRCDERGRPVIVRRDYAMSLEEAFLGAMKRTRIPR